MIPETLEAMLSGPGRARFVFQPLLAIVLGVRDGRSDSALGRPPYLYALAFTSVRKQEVTTALRTLTKPLAIAVILDAILQYVIFDAVRLWQALVVGIALIALPYAVARGLTGRYLRRRSHQVQAGPAAGSVRRVRGSPRTYYRKRRHGF